MEKELIERLKKREKLEEDKNVEEESEDSLEEELKKEIQETDSKKFQNFMHLGKFSSGILNSGGLTESVAEGIVSRQTFEDSVSEGQIKYNSSVETGLKYEHESSGTLKRKSFEQEARTPENILKHEMEIHKQTFIQDPMLKNVEPEKDYIPLPKSRTTDVEFETIPDDYKIN